jgi:hemerythrin
MEALHWLPEYASGLPAMDAAHREFLDCVSVLLTCRDDALPAALDAFSTHAVVHFGDEDRLLVSTAYPASQCHLDEHAAVLRSLEDVRRALLGGNTSVVRGFAAELARWFPEHAAAMDHGLARWAEQQRLGGAPIAIRRHPMTHAG